MTGRDDKVAGHPDAGKMSGERAFEPTRLGSGRRSARLPVPLHSTRSSGRLLAYAWYNLAAAQGNEVARKNKDNLRTRMTPDQIARAQELSTPVRKYGDVF